jgi:hypothetical protein
MIQSSGSTVVLAWGVRTPINPSGAYSTVIRHLREPSRGAAAST